MRIASVACHVPSVRVDAEEIIRAAGGTPMEARVFSRMFGIERVAVSPAGQSLSERFFILLDKIEARHSGELPDVAIYTHGIPVQYSGRAMPVDLLVDRHPFLRNVRRTFEVDQHNCAGLFWAIDIAGKLLSADLARSVVVLAGDSHAELPVKERYIPGCTLLGDAFAGLTLDAATGGVQLRDLALSCHPQFAFGQYGTPDEMRWFNASHTAFVQGALGSVSYPWEPGEPILPHNINRLVWDQFCRATGLSRGLVKLDLLPEIGHCYTADPLVVLERHFSKPEDSGRGVTLLSVGLGAFIGACRVVWPSNPSAGATHAYC